MPLPLQKTLRLPLTLSLALSLSGCAITLNMPANRFESPEVSDVPLKFHLEAGLAGTNEVTAVSDTTNAPPSYVATVTSSVTNLQYGAGITVMPQVEVSLKASNDYPYMARAKWQVLGEPRGKNPVGGFALALSGGFGLSNREQTDTDSFSSVTARSETGFIGYDAALILGYRVSENILMYGGPFYSAVKMDGTIQQGTTTYDWEGNATHRGINLGFEVGTERFSGMVEAGYAGTSYKGAQLENVYLGAAVRIGAR